MQRRIGFVAPSRDDCGVDVALRGFIHTGHGLPIPRETRAHAPHNVIPVVKVQNVLEVKQDPELEIWH